VTASATTGFWFAAAEAQTQCGDPAVVCRTYKDIRYGYGAVPAARLEWLAWNAGTTTYPGSWEHPFNYGNSDGSISALSKVSVSGVHCELDRRMEHLAHGAPVLAAPSFSVTVFIRGPVGTPWHIDQKRFARLYAEKTTCTPATANGHCRTGGGCSGVVPSEAAEPFSCWSGKAGIYAETYQCVHGQLVDDCNTPYTSQRNVLASASDSPKQLGPTVSFNTGDAALGGRLAFLSVFELGSVIKTRLDYPTISGNDQSVPEDGLGFASSAQLELADPAPTVFQSDSVMSVVNTFVKPPGDLPPAIRFRVRIRDAFSDVTVVLRASDVWLQKQGATEQTPSAPPQRGRRT